MHGWNKEPVNFAQLKGIEMVLVITLLCPQGPLWCISSLSSSPVLGDPIAHPHRGLRLEMLSQGEWVALTTPVTFRPCPTPSFIS